MAGIINHNTSDNDSYTHPLYLSPNQQDLLLTALSSNDTKSSIPRSADPKSYAMDMNGNFAPQQFTPLAFDNVNYEESPFVDPLEFDGSFDYGVDVDTDGAMIGPLPGDDDLPSPTDGDMHDKRKSPSDDFEFEEGNKRHESEEKTAKKPGRKPLTSEPTTKRKAQNRAAQRAFRERKEKHLKDLETKVTELEKRSESVNHENGLLRAQVTRLQTELREYRKRLSLNRSGISGSPPSGSREFSSYLGGLSNSAGANNNFQFEFPRFGGLPTGHLFNNGSISKTAVTAASDQKVGSSNNGPGVLSRSDSSSSQHARSGSMTASPGRFNSGTTQSPLSASNGDDMTGLVGNGPRGSTDSSSGRSRVFQFNSNSSNSASPSASSASYHGTASSCGTSPEPSHNSPKDVITEHAGYVCHGNSEGEISFCEKLNMACGNPRNPIPRAKSMDQTVSNGVSAANNMNGAAAVGINASPSIIDNATTAQAGTNNPTGKDSVKNKDDFGFDLLANQNGGQFDPTLFGEYRESQAAVVGDGDFTSGFFNEAFPFPDFGSPLSNFANTGLTPAVERKANPMDAIDRIQNGEDDDEVVPGEAPGLSCHQIWDKLQTQPGFTDGNFDIDGLCSELRAKAKCSESGVVVDQRDVDEALKRLPQRA